LKRGLILIWLILTAFPAMGEIIWTLHSDASYLRGLSLSDDALWAVGQGGALRQDRSSGELTFIRATEGLPSHSLTTVMALSDEEIWIGTDGEGLLRYRPEESDPWTQYKLLPQSLAGDEVLCLAVDGQGRIWYGCREQDLASYVAGGFGVMDENSPGDIWGEPEGLANLTVNALAFAGGELFVGTEEGIYLLDADEVLSYEAEGPLGAVDGLAVAGGRVWALTDSELHSRPVDGGEWVRKFMPETGYTPSSLVSVEDTLYLAMRNSNVGTLAYGYDTLGQTWTDLSAGMPEPDWLPDYGNPVYSAICAGPAGELWLGGHVYRNMGPGILHRSGDSWERTALDQGPMGPATKSLSFGPSGNLWTNSDAGAAYQDTDGNWTRQRRLEDLHNWPSWSLEVLEDSQGYAWFCPFAIAYDDAFARLELSTGLVESMPVGANGLPSTRVLAMLEDSAGTRWFATEDAGIGLLSAAGDWSLLNSDPANGSLPTPNINALAFLDGGRVAMLCSGVGLCIWDGVSQWWKPGDGIIDSSGDLAVTTTGGSLSAIPGGGVWVGQLDGLIRVAPSGSAYIAQGKLRQSDGSAPGLLSSLVKDVATGPGGEAWVATELGISQVDLDLDAGSWLVDNYTNKTGLAEAGAAFGPEVLAPLPDHVYDRIAVSPDGSRIVAGSRSQGLVELESRPDPPSDPEEIARIRLYPNPVRLSLGQSEVYCMGVDFPVDVRIYNLEGQLVRELLEVQPGEPVWPDLGTRFGSRAVSGIYLIHLSYEGKSEVRTLALLR
jgi:ligand-binding sensor domain-containing protein